jgi:membrane protease YdiL (CAAX protease family)
MVGIAVQLLISWLLLKYIEKANLHALGITPVLHRTLQFLMGIIFAGLLCLIHAMSKNYLNSLEWHLNPRYTLPLFFDALLYCMKSVFYEELIFRGALCYIGFRRCGVKITMLFSSVCFGVYHWFTLGVLGDPKMMIIVFVLTSLYGWTLAYSYYKTKSIFLGCGLHLGWLIVSLIVFSGGTIGEQLLIPYKPEGSAELSGTAQTLFFFAQLFGIPLCQYLLVRVIIKIKLFDSTEK